MPIGGVPPARVVLIRSQVAWAIQPCHRVGLCRLSPAAPAFCGDRESPFTFSARAPCPQAFNSRRLDSPGMELACPLARILQDRNRLHVAASVTFHPSFFASVDSGFSPGRARVLRRSEKSFRLSGRSLRLLAVVSRRLVSPGMGVDLRRGDPPAAVRPIGLPSIVDLIFPAPL